MSLPTNFIPDLKPGVKQKAMLGLRQLEIETEL